MRLLEGTFLMETATLPNLPRLEWVQTIRDPIWQEIPITEVEKSIIQTESFYRLRGIKQLSFAYLAFPGAVHSRFEHSLGVMHATDMLLKMAGSDENGEGLVINSFQRQMLRLAALLHDIGHPPFSHVMENLFTYYPDTLEANLDNLPANFRTYLAEHKKTVGDITSHEFFSEYIIREHDDIKGILRAWIREKSNLPIKLSEQYENTITNVIAQLAIGKRVSINQNEVTEDLLQLIPIFKSIMSGDIDADKIDYLMRDNYYCGLPQAIDITSLRGNLLLTPGELEIKPEAIGFVHSLILARFSLIRQVHQEMWGVFTTAKVIELLHDLLQKENNPSEKIIEIFTGWDDSDLLKYLFESGDKIIRNVVSTRYRLKELARLENLDTHPHIRECIQLLTESIHHRQIPRLQQNLRDAIGNQNIYIHVHNIKSPEFSMRLSNGGDLLRDQILRGISEESFSNLGIVVYGEENFNVDFYKIRAIDRDFLPCEDCTLGYDCVNNLHDRPQIKLLAELAVKIYRQIIQEFNVNTVLGADYLLLILEQIAVICKRENLEPPIRQSIYQVAKLIARNLENTLEIRGNISLRYKNITSSFDQEIRKYEQMGMIAYSRQVRNLPSESGPNREVFRFDRRFQLSDYGRMRLTKVRDLGETVSAYKQYVQSWDLVEAEIQRNESQIIQLLSGK